MTVDKNITVDLARIQPHKVIKIHEGDVNSVFLVLTVLNGGSSVSLSGLTIKYDAVVNNYLVEQDASGSVDSVHNTIRIPVTSNMTAMSGTLRIDVRMKSGTQVLYTQTITAIVEKSVVDGDTIIDFSGITIVQRMDALEVGLAEKLNYKNVQLTGDSYYPNIDTAIESDVIYRVLLGPGNSFDGWCVFNGYRNYSAGTEVSQIRTDRSGNLFYRTGTTTGSYGTVLWSDEWKQYAPLPISTLVYDNNTYTISNPSGGSVTFGDVLAQLNAGQNTLKVKLSGSNKYYFATVTEYSAGNDTSQANSITIAVSVIDFSNGVWVLGSASGSAADPFSLVLDTFGTS